MSDRTSVFLRLGPRVPETPIQTSNQREEENINRNRNYDANKSNNENNGNRRRGDGRRRGHNNTRSQYDQERSQATRSDYNKELSDLKAKLAALEQEKQDAKDLADLLMMQNYELQSEKSKIQQEKNAFEREQNNLVERLAYLQVAAEDKYIRDEQYMHLEGGEFSNTDYQDEPPITPDTGMLRALREAETAFVTGDENDHIAQKLPL